MEDNQGQTILEEDVLEDMEDHQEVEIQEVEIQEMIEAVEEDPATEAVVKIATAVAVDGNYCKT
jgi:hypothetical protein